MTIPKTKFDLFELTVSFVRYAPDLTQWEYIDTISGAEDDYDKVIELAMADDPEALKRLRNIAKAAFAECRRGNREEAREHFYAITDELGPSIGLPPSKRAR